ncbi:ATP-binding protein [Clostridium guangxiense]|uniref:ATP-binding protein n=1 Tax=Clostridium guangxiense TaxID=1662055 RepID=UPI001E469B59|nr:ATP-binding protein [Clostridium guangxiense]MCD2345860.1 ATP-binding protein [Clostridium guangxiense]
MSNKIGRISATEKNPTSNDEFIFWLGDEAEIKPFDIIKAENNIGKKKSISYAIVKEIYHQTDSAGHLSNYISSDFGDIDCEPMTKHIGVTYATASVISNTKDVYMPLKDNVPVYFAEKDEVKEALGLNEIKNPIPAGFIEGTNNISVPIALNKEFLIGPEGAHLNISGISGLATKTSYAMFLLQAIQQKTNDTAIIILNVKGADLLRLDQENPELTEQQVDAWKKSGLKCKPFDNVKYYYPYKSNCEMYCSNTSLEKESLEKQNSEKKSKNYIYTYKKHKVDLDLLFSNVDDPTYTMESIMNYIVESSDFYNLTWEEFKTKLGEYCKSGERGHKGDITVQSWRKFKRLINKSINSEIFQEAKSSNPSRNQCYLSDEIKQINGNDVLVVDIAKLEEQLQYLVFGDVLKSVYELKLGETDREEGNIPRQIIIFVDELNKYAGSSAPKSSPILKYLLEITERGRSEGIILFSAEQFKSDIHDRIKGNCSTHVYGRTNAIEVSKPDYRYIPKVYSNMMTRLVKGELILQHSIFGTPLKISFPYPSYNQKSDLLIEVGDEEDE